MDDIIVSVKIPEPLLSELKHLIEKGHYMDISESIRSIIRDNWLSFEQPELHKLKQIRNEISSGLKKRSEKIVMKDVIAELQKIKQQIKEVKI